MPMQYREVQERIHDWNIILVNLNCSSVWSLFHCASDIRHKSFRFSGVITCLSGLITIPKSGDMWFSILSHRGSAFHNIWHSRFCGVFARLCCLSLSLRCPECCDLTYCPTGNAHFTIYVSNVWSDEPAERTYLISLISDVICHIVKHVNARYIC